MNNRDWWLIAIVATAFFIRVGYIFVSDHKNIESDERGYVSYALNIDKKGRFVETIPHRDSYRNIQEMWNIEKNVETYRDYGISPGYPSFLYALFYIFGYNQIHVKIIQALLSSLTCLIAYLIAVDIYREKSIGLVAALLMAFYAPLFYRIIDRLQTETLFIFLLMLSIWLLQKGRQRAYYSLISGLVFGLSSLVRPVLFYFPIGLWVIAILLSLKTPRRILIVSSLFILGHCLALTPWSIKSIRDYDTILPARYGGIALFKGTFPDSDKYTEAENMLRPEFQEIWDPNLSYPEQDKKLYRAAVDNVLRNPLETLRLFLKKHTIFWLNIGYPKKFPSKASILLAIVNMSLIFFAALGFLLEPTVFRRSYVILLLIVFSDVTGNILQVVFRYSLPMYPFIIIFASSSVKVCLMSIYNKISQLQGKHI